MNFLSVLCLVVFIIICDASSCNTLIKPGTNKEFLDATIIWGDVINYKVTKRLGSGSFGEAFLGYNTVKKDQVTVKLYQFGKMKRKRMLREIFVCQTMCGHKNVIRLLDVVKQSLTGYPALVFEYVKDAKLADMIPYLSVDDMRFYAYEILNGIANAHSKNIIHKDLKPENVVVNPSERVLKIIDWGLSNFYTKGEQQSIGGSLQYKSPEMLLDYPYAGLSTDIWSYGCMLAMMLYSPHAPFFYGSNEMNQLHIIAKTLGTQGLLDTVQRYNMSFNASSIHTPIVRVPWEEAVRKEREDYATPLALDLLDRLLRYDPEERITAEEALNHPYFLHERHNSSSTITSTSTSSTSGRRKENILQLYHNNTG